MWEQWIVWFYFTCFCRFIEHIFLSQSCVIASTVHCNALERYREDNTKQMGWFPCVRSKKEKPQKMTFTANLQNNFCRIIFILNTLPFISILTSRSLFIKNKKSKLGTLRTNTQHNPTSFWQNWTILRKYLLSSFDHISDNKGPNKADLPLCLLLRHRSVIGVLNESGRWVSGWWGGW